MYVLKNKIILSVFLFFFTFSLQATCLDKVDKMLLLQKLVSLDNSYGDVKLPIQCDAKLSPTENVICNNTTLKAMALVDAKAWVYTVENATHTELDHSKIHTDQDWHQEISTACSDNKECLCYKLKEHINSSIGTLGGGNLD